MAFAIRGGRLAVMPTGALTSAFITAVVVVSITALLLAASIVAGIGVIASGAATIWIEVATLVVTVEYATVELLLLVAFIGVAMLVNSYSVFDAEHAGKRQFRALLRSHTARWVMLWFVSLISAGILTVAVGTAGRYVAWLLVQGVLVGAGVMACIGLKRLRTSSKRPLLDGLTLEQQNLVFVKPRSGPLWNEPPVAQILDADEARNYAHLARQKAKSLQVSGLGVFIVASAFIANSVQLMWELPSERWTSILPACVILAALGGWLLQDSAKRYIVLAERYDARALELDRSMQPARWWARLPWQRQGVDRQLSKVRRIQ